MSSEPLQSTDMTVGEILRRTRLHYNQSLPDIERALRIRAEQIEAIETGDYSKLPGRVYAIGFVRSYSEYLGLDGDKMVRLYKNQSGAKTIKPELNFPVAAADSKIPPVWVVSASAIAFLLVVALWWGFSGGERNNVTEIPAVPATMSASQETVPDVEQAAGSAAVNSEAAAATSATIAATTTAPAAPAVTVQEGIILNIRQNSWVEIKDKDGKALVSRVLKEGDKYYVPDRPDLSMSLGNAGGIEIEVDGQRLKPLGSKGDVRRNIPLDAEFLKKNFAMSVATETAAPPAAEAPAAAAVQ